MDISASKARSIESYSMFATVNIKLFAQPMT